MVMLAILGFWSGCSLPGLIGFSFGLLLLDLLVVDLLLPLEELWPELHCRDWIVRQPSSAPSG